MEWDKCCSLAEKGQYFAEMDSIFFKALSCSTHSFLLSNSAAPRISANWELDSVIGLAAFVLGLLAGR
jgi:hypothetical protein